MNREDAFEIMQQGGYITHPTLMKADAGPLSLNGDTVCGKNGDPLNSKWSNQIDSECFNTGWMVCDEKGNPLTT